MNARLILARAVTVAVRYLSIRRQFRDRDNPDSTLPETAVLDYSTVQIRVLTLLATTFALHYGGTAMRELYERTRSVNALDGDRAQLAELHSTSAGLKSLATDLAANGIETCRRAMGGHGFGGGTGLVQLNADYLSKPTVEGDNWMITQQAARFLLNKVGDALKPKMQGSQSRTEANLREYSACKEHPQPLANLDDDAAIARAFEWRVSFFAFNAYEAREIEKRTWNSLLIDLYKLSRAYSQSMLVGSFLDGIQNANLSATTQDVLRDLYRLFAMHTMDSEAREFQKSGAVTPEILDSLPDRVRELMDRIRPHAVRLVDSLAIPDYLLDSALGRYDGKVYEDLFYRAHVLNPLNKITFNPDYRTDEIVKGSGDGGKILAKL
jgi:acyl-CoA oxidase